MRNRRLFYANQRGQAVEKIVWILKSRKFWTAIIGLAVSFGLLQLSDTQEAELVSAILTVATAIGYMVSVAVEDAGRHVGGTPD